MVIARGELKGMGAERPIKAPVSGVVSGIPVTEGELVTPGQVLIQFDPEVNTERLRRRTLKRIGKQAPQRRNSSV